MVAKVRRDKAGRIAVSPWLEDFIWKIKKVLSPNGKGGPLFAEGTKHIVRKLNRKFGSGTATVRRVEGALYYLRVCYDERDPRFDFTVPRVRTGPSKKGVWKYFVFLRNDRIEPGDERIEVYNVNDNAISAARMAALEGESRTRELIYRAMTDPVLKARAESQWYQSRTTIAEFKVEQALKATASGGTGPGPGPGSSARPSSGSAPTPTPPSRVYRDRVHIDESDIDDIVINDTLH